MALFLYWLGLGPNPAEPVHTDGSPVSILD